MKKLTLSFFAAALVATVISCKKTTADSGVTAEQQEAAQKTGAEYKADTAASTVKWNATHKGGLAPRFGTLKLSDGVLSVEDGTVTGGDFVVDINSLAVDPASVTEPGKKPEELAGHLKSADFFDAEKYPTAKFEITGITPFDASKDKSKLEGATNIVSGNLTLKDKTVNVTFPAKISITDTEVTLVANFSVDRTSWNLSYGAEGDPQDWAISKDIDIALDVKAVK